MWVPRRETYGLSPILCLKLYSLLHYRDISETLVLCDGIASALCPQLGNERTSLAWRSAQLMEMPLLE